ARACRQAGRGGPRPLPRTAWYLLKLLIDTPGRAAKSPARCHESSSCTPWGQVRPERAGSGAPGRFRRKALNDRQDGMQPSLRRSLLTAGRSPEATVSWSRVDSNRVLGDLLRIMD